MQSVAVNGSRIREEGKSDRKKKTFSGHQDCIIDEILKLLGFKRRDIVIFCKRCVDLGK